MRFGLLSYETVNLGDEIQSIAARRFLPRVDCLVPRERLDVVPGTDGPVRLILNGWFLHDPARWPPHPSYEALPISIHLANRRPSRRRFWEPVPAAAMLGKSGREWFASHGPVGARDQETLQLLRAKRIEAYQSSCLTLTLERLIAPRQDYVVACDLPTDVMRALAARTRSQLISVSHIDTETVGFAARSERASALLGLYARARAVVTSRLHCALPCLALGTPVLFVRVQPDHGRQQPAMDLTHSCDPAAFLAGQVAFDADDPPPNPSRHIDTATALAARCAAFIAS